MRATLAARWALTHGSPPPVAFAELLPLIGDDSPTAEVLQFVALKQEGMESDAFPVSDALRSFLADTRAACEAEQESLTAEPPDMTPLDDYFQHTLAAWP